MRSSAAVGLWVVLLAAAFLALALARPAAADDYRMRIESSGLSPASLTIRPVDRVVFVNGTRNSWRVQVGSTYDVVLFPGQATDGAALDPEPFQPPSVGSYRVVASSPAAGNDLAATITVRSATPAPTPKASPSPARTPSPDRTPRVAPSPTTSAPKPAATSTSSAPKPAASSTSSAPKPAKTSTPKAATSTAAAGGDSGGSGGGGSGTSSSGTPIGGPVENVDGNGIGLPAAVASVLVAGLLAAWVRVLLAEPVAVHERSGLS